MKKSCLAVLGGSVLFAAGAFAHHSFAMFDSDKQMTLDGTIKEFQWTNPHTFIHIMVKDPKTGQEVEWAVEGSPTTSLKRRGWSRNSLKPGDKATIVLNPLRSGGAGGGLVSVTVDGKPVGGPPPT